MILPTKGIPASKALITVGSEILVTLGESSLTISGLWLKIGDRRKRSDLSRISYDWFVLAVDLLYALGAVHLTDLGLLKRSDL